MAGSGHLSTKLPWRRVLLVAVFGGLLCASLIWHVLLQGDPRIIKWVCTEAEVVEHCEDWLNFTLPGSGAAEEWILLHNPPLQDKPCCYFNDRDDFADPTELCNPNVVRPADQKPCRTGSRKPEGKLEGGNYIISLKDTDSRDVGNYKVFKPYNSKHPQKELNVGYEDIVQHCSKTVKPSCHMKWWLILIACCSIAALLLIVTLLMIFAWNIFPCCRKNQDPEQANEIGLTEPLN